VTFDRQDRWLPSLFFVTSRATVRDSPGIQLTDRVLETCLSIIENVIVGETNELDSHIFQGSG
jgi:hypothetical protein